MGAGRGVEAAGGSASSAVPAPRLGEHLVAARLCPRDAVDAALMEQKVTGERLGLILVRNGFIAHRDLIAAILRIAPDRIVTERVAVTRVPVKLLDELSVLIAAETADTLYAATLSDESFVRAMLAEHYPDKRIAFVSLSPDTLDEFVDRMEANERADDVRSGEERTLDRLLHRALSEGASDVHLVPREKSFSAFFRYLGVRRLVHEGTVDEYLTVSSQVKDRAKMDLAERRVPQDGAFQVEHNGRPIDVRVATIPGVQGEIAVMRLLDPDRVRLTLDGLGITRVDHWRRGVSRQDGLCLICGPTGSGKTTTLNATAQEVDRFGKAFYTVEDPVEYRIPFTGQVATNPAIDLDFARVTRAFMRADPDVISIGEVRDAETARAAIKAADTGHLVVATLHTGSVLGAVSRLRDLDVPPYELKYLLRAVLVQNLVRTVCDICRGAGCKACGGTGYAGRTVVSECASFDDVADVERLLEGEVSWTLKVDDAIAKAEAGITSFDELRRVFGAEVDRRLDLRRAGGGS